MSIDQKTSVSDTERDEAGAVIENEIPTYRAISGRAIFCLVCGVLSVFSFAHPIFYVFSVLAVGMGIWAPLDNSVLARHADGPRSGEHGHRPGDSLWRGLLDDHNGAVLRARPAGDALRKEVRQGP